MTAKQQLDQGWNVLISRGISKETAYEEMRKIYPDAHLTVESAWLVAQGEAFSWMSAPHDCDVEALARYIAQHSGAFPWDGPVGNGLTVASYQAHLREIAAQHIQAWIALGLVEDQSL